MLVRTRAFPSSISVRPLTRDKSKAGKPNYQSSGMAVQTRECPGSWAVSRCRYLNTEDSCQQSIGRVPQSAYAFIRQTTKFNAAAKLTQAR